MNIIDKEYYEECVAFAKSIGMLEGEGGLLTALERLEKWNGDDYEVHLYTDFAPYSFYFLVQNKETSRTRMNGGVIFHGPHDGYGNGGAPTFSVSLTGTKGWSIHT